MSKFDFATWPPKLTKNELAEIKTLATTYSLANGICYLPPKTPITTQQAIHAPISIAPSPLPTSLFKEVWDIQKSYNEVYSKITMDEEFLDSVFGEMGDVDDFVGRMWKGWKGIRGERRRSQVHLGLFRSDYLLHTSPSPSELNLKQVEFNTISSSFGGLSERVSAMHRYISKQTNNYFGTISSSYSLPSNEPSKGLAAGLAEAHRYYCSQYPSQQHVVILFVVQPNERNVFDQRHLEYQLLETHNIRVARRTLTELSECLELVSSGNTDPILQLGKEEISVVYYRAGYTPDDYPTDKEWCVRFDVDRSRAIPCPTLPLHLAGSKIIQQVLSQEGILEKYLPTTHLSTSIRKTWMKMWSLDEPGILDFLIENNNYERMVIKPQREGGGNNIYHNTIPSFLSNLPSEERKAWIVMELIHVPRSVGGYLVRSDTETVSRTEVVSELGIFGWSLFQEGEEIKEDTVGYLVRTKDVGSDEGGVARGFSVVDSLVLV